MDSPWLIKVRLEASEPSEPIEPVMVWRDDARELCGIAWLALEFVLFPLFSRVQPEKDDLCTFLAHRSECPIGVHELEFIK
jgi:hypothetical protein